eukprot:403360507
MKSSAQYFKMSIAIQTARIKTQCFSRNQKAEKYSESDDVCTIGTDNLSSSLISYQAIKSPNQTSSQQQQRKDQYQTNYEITQKSLKNQFLTLQVEDQKQNSSSKQNQNLEQTALDSSRVKNIKSSWVEQTTSINSCFLNGRGSSYGTQSHITVHSAMDQVILKHHKAAQKQYIKMRSLRGPTSTTNKQFSIGSRSGFVNQDISQNLSSSQFIQNDAQSYQDIYSQRKKSVQHVASINPQMRPTHFRTGSQNEPSQNQMKIQESTLTSKNQQDQKVFIFPQNTLEYEDHYQDTYNTISSLVNGLNNRKQSFGGASTSSILSQTRRVTDSKPFPLSRSNSRRTKDVLQEQTQIQEQQNMNFKAKRAPGPAPSKFFALKSTKALTIPQEFNLHTDQREQSKQRELSQTNRNINMQTYSSIGLQGQTSVKNLNIKSDMFQSFDSSESYGNFQSIKQIPLNQQLTKTQTINHNREVSSNINIHNKNLTQNSSRIQMGQTLSQPSITKEITTNKFLKGNIKKMKIGHNYAQLVNYAKSKFVQ